MWYNEYMQLTRIMNFRVTEVEYQALMKLAELEDRPVSRIIRRLVFPKMVVVDVTQPTTVSPLVGQPTPVYEKPGTMAVSQERLTIPAKPFERKFSPDPKPGGSKS